VEFANAALWLLEPMVSPVGFKRKLIAPGAPGAGVKLLEDFGSRAVNGCWRDGVAIFIEKRSRCVAEAPGERRRPVLDRSRVTQVENVDDIADLANGLDAALRFLKPPRVPRYVDIDLCPEPLKVQTFACRISGAK
jgi:hypothetical protein